MTTQTLTITDLLNDAPRLWTGHSGEQATGEQVAHHLEATIAYLERVGWERTFATTNDDAAELHVNDSMTVKGMLRSLIDWVRTQNTTGSRNLPLALSHIANTDDGDTDTHGIASRLCDFVIRARTNNTYANAAAWASKLGRTWPEVKQLLTEAADVARTHGPTA